MYSDLLVQSNDPSCLRFLLTRMRDGQLSVGAFVRIVVRQRVVGEVKRRQTYTVKHRVDRRNHAMPLSRRTAALRWVRGDVGHKG